MELSWEKTRAPRIEAPATAPISRLVLAAEAAMPDRSGGTASSTAAVTGTTVMPMPTPASARASDSGEVVGVLGDQRARDQQPGREGRAADRDRPARPGPRRSSSRRTATR